MSRLVENIDESLEAIEEILGALLDISRLDAGAMTTSISSFKMADLMRSLEIEFAPIARAKGLELAFVPCSLPVESDRSLLRRLLQNLISNAIKYTPRGRVLVGCRRHGQSLKICVYDTGVGIPRSSAARSSRNSTASNRARGSPAASASACRSSSGWRACSTTASPSMPMPAAARCFP